jgi:hypothetical protein
VRWKHELARPASDNQAQVQPGITATHVEAEHHAEMALHSGCFSISLGA